MSGDTCGYPTQGGDGPPCENPATEDGNCWLKAHGGDVENGRDFVLGESDHEDILEAARMGASKSGCARAAGTGPDQLQRYVDAHPDFREAFIRARAKGEQRLLSGPLINDEEQTRQMDGQHARFLLSTSFDYKKTEKRELEHSGGIEGSLFELPSEVTDNWERTDGDD